MIQVLSQARLHSGFGYWVRAFILCGCLQLLPQHYGPWVSLPSRKVASAPGR